jgi:hypothetical protein
MSSKPAAINTVPALLRMLFPRIPFLWAAAMRARRSLLVRRVDYTINAGRFRKRPSSEYWLRA